jgi:hypothetical protein
MRSAFAHAIAANVIVDLAMNANVRARFFPCPVVFTMIVPSETRGGSAS